MAKTYKISKKKIIQALKTERLHGGSWYDDSEVEKLLWSNKNDLTGVERSIAEKLSERVTLETAKKVCTVCAVGAIFANVLEPSADLADVDTACNSAVSNEDGAGVNALTNKYGVPDVDLANERFAYMTKRGMYMSALSMLFETLWEAAYDRREVGNVSRHQVYRIRQKLIAAVKKHFPSSVTVSIDSSLPVAKDIARA